MNPTITITLKQYDDAGRTKILEIPDALVDTGATQSYISSYSVPNLMKQTKLQKPEIVGNAFSDKISTIKHKITANLYLDDFDIEISGVDLYIVDRQMKHNAIIGMDILQNFKIDLREEKIKLMNNLYHEKSNEVSTIIFEKQSPFSPDNVICSQDTEVAPHSDRKVYFSHKIDRKDKKFFNCEDFMENNIFINIYILIRS